MSMLLENSFFLSKYFLQLNFYFLFFIIFISAIVFYLSKYFNLQYFYRNSSSLNFLRLFLIGGLIVSFLIHCVTFWLYSNMIYYFISFNISDNYFVIPNLNYFYKLNFLNLFDFSVFNLYFSMDFFGFILLFLAYIVGIISILALDTRLYWKNIKYLFSFNIFALIVYLYVSVTNLVFFFLLYEFLLIFSFFFVFFVSPSRRAIQASLYFVIWTQLGSFIVLCAVSYILATANSFDFFSLKLYKFNEYETIFIYTMLFLGFGFKVPIWPFHYWLTKTHVEAPSGFSIYLSGFLVKSALYGFYKLTTSIFMDLNTSFFVMVTMFGVIDSSLKMWGQTDLKKLVAYGTIQEMNLIFLVFCWGDTNAIVGGILFTATHSFLSALMFFLVDCIYRRYHTRSLIEVNGILHMTPNLGIAILVMTVFFSGLPGTIKYITEFYIFSGFLETSVFSCFFLMFVANVLGLIGFSKCWFNAVFGMMRKHVGTIPLDLTIKELLVLAFCFFFLFIFSFFVNFLI